MNKVWNLYKSIVGIGLIVFVFMFFFFGGEFYIKLNIRETIELFKSKK